MGSLFVRNCWAERMRPAYLSRFGVDLGGAHEAAGSDGATGSMPARIVSMLVTITISVALPLRRRLDNSWRSVRQRLNAMRSDCPTGSRMGCLVWICPSMAASPVQTRRTLSASGTS